MQRWAASAIARSTRRFCYSPSESRHGVDHHVSGLSPPPPALAVA